MRLTMCLLCVLVLAMAACSSDDEGGAGKTVACSLVNQSEVEKIVGPVVEPAEVEKQLKGGVLSQCEWVSRSIKEGAMTVYFYKGPDAGASWENGRVPQDGGYWEINGKEVESPWTEARVERDSVTKPGFESHPLSIFMLGDGFSLHVRAENPQNNPLEKDVVSIARKAFDRAK